jgi:hypothetical protein
VGWHGDQYVLPDKDEIMLFQSTGGITSKFKQSGTLNEWKNNVVAYCQGNSRLAFCVFGEIVPSENPPRLKSRVRSLADMIIRVIGA